MNKEYICVMFPYPSGDGLHVGHVYNYAIIDSYCKWRRYNGIDVFQPFGYDSFGLPAENYAKKHNRDAREVTYENIENFRTQMKTMNTDYEELLITSDTSYYKWSQWLFSELLSKGLAYKKMGPVNHCSSCETVLANEQVKDDKCDRCGTVVEVKNLEQWYFKITDYKQRLIDGLKTVDYPEKTKKQQLHWLDNLQDWCVSRQRIWGSPIPLENETDTLDTFVDSSFYYLRYLDPNNNDKLLDFSKHQQVDLYVGGNEHACMHLIYARFINMFLFDCGYISTEEPFKKLIHQGMITYKGEKMSKSKGNVINPDDYDSDELRLYSMFIGHYFDGGDWNDDNIIGIRRFIGRFKKWINEATDDGISIEIIQFENKIDNFVSTFKFNKVISTFMEFYNLHKNIKIDKVTANKLIEIFKVFAPSFKL